MKRQRINPGQYVLTAIAVIYAFMCLLPVVLIVIVSFSSDASIAQKGFSFFPNEFSLKAWAFVFGYGRQLWVSYGVTIFVTITGTCFGLTVMSMFAYTLSRSCFELRKYLAAMMVFTMLLSGGQLASYMINTTMYGLNDHILALILPGVGVMQIIIMRTYIRETIGESLIESARIDGAGEFKTFWQIVFPLMKPTLAAVGFMLVISYWNDWQRAYLYISSPAKTPLQLLLVRIEKSIEFISQNAGDIPAEEYARLLKEMPRESGRMALLLITLGPILIAYPFFQKYFVKGMMLGSVKG